MAVKDSKWYQTVWLPFAAGTYIVICLFDFIIMPVYVAAHNSKIEQIVFKELAGKDLSTFATTMAQTAQATRQWNPLTLMGAGMFHLAFGALLTGGAVTRGLSRKSEIEGYYKYGSAGYEQDDSYGYGRDESQYGGNAPYRPNRPGAYNRYRNAREGEPDKDADKPMPKTTELDDETK